MGVNGLITFLAWLNELYNFVKKFPEVKINELRGKYVVVDAMQILYSFAVGILIKKEELTMMDDESISHYQIPPSDKLHIVAILTDLYSYVSHGIIPIYIFDGKNPGLKKATQQIRKTKRLESRAIVASTTDSKQRKTHIRRTYTPSSEDVDECMKLLTILGIPNIRASGEADPLCVALAYAHESIYGVVTHDSDAIVFGAPIILRRDKSSKNEPSFSKLDFSVILSLLSRHAEHIFDKYKLQKKSFTKEQVVDLALLIGSDYNDPAEPGKSIEDIFEKYISFDMDIKKYINSLPFENVVPKLSCSPTESKTDVFTKEMYWNCLCEVKKYYMDVLVYSPEQVPTKLKQPLIHEFDKLREYTSIVNTLTQLMHLISSAGGDETKIFDFRKRKDVTTHRIGTRSDAMNWRKKDDVRDSIFQCEPLKCFTSFGSYNKNVYQRKQKIQ